MQLSGSANITSQSATTVTAESSGGRAFPAAAAAAAWTASSEQQQMLLQEAIACYLPSNYDFEVEKALRRINDVAAKRVALQLPEGLLRWALQLAAIFEAFCASVETVTILADVTYGACCIDDLTAVSVGCDFLIHYGHSCLVPLSHHSKSFTSSSSQSSSNSDNSSSRVAEKNERSRGLLGCLYVFVDILIDPLPLCAAIKINFSKDARLALLGTIQYAKFIHAVRRQLMEEKYFSTPPVIPQRAPLTAGEVLGCTAPKLTANAFSPSHEVVHNSGQKALPASSPSSSSSSSTAFFSTSTVVQAESRNASTTMQTLPTSVMNAAITKRRQTAAGAAATAVLKAAAAAGGGGEKNVGAALETVLDSGDVEDCVTTNTAPALDDAAAAAALWQQLVAQAGVPRTSDSLPSFVESHRWAAAPDAEKVNASAVFPSSDDCRCPPASGGVKKLSNRSSSSSSSCCCSSVSVCADSAKDCADFDQVIFVADGRFHLEACMIQNPGLQFLRYDPFLKRLFREKYDFAQLHESRKAAITAARSARNVALLLSTLGRQGSVGIGEDLIALLDARKIPYCLVLFSELSPLKLQRLGRHIDCFIQIACPRLSIDWGTGYATGGKPLLTPYEAHVAFGKQPYLDVYPMDYYSKDGGAWTNYNTSSGHRSGSLAPLVSLQDQKAQLRERLRARQQQQQQRRSQH